MDGRNLDGSRLSVQYAGTVKQNQSINLFQWNIGAHKKGGTIKGPNDKDVCFNCGKKGHW